MAKNLRHLLRSIIMTCFLPGLDKHALKKVDAGMFGIIFSYSAKFATLNLIDTFCKWIKLNCIPCKKPTDITTEIVTQFLTEKVAEGCTQYTIDTYRNRFVKIGECISKMEHVDLDLHVPRVHAMTQSRDDRGAKAVMPREEYDQILAYIQSHPCGSGLAIMLENSLGARVTDVCERMTIRGDTIHLICKGRKELDRPIDDNIRAILDDSRFSTHIKNNAFELPRSKSVNNYLRALEDRLGLTRHSFHDIRRLIAQEKYDEYRHSGMERLEALRAVGVWLNHGPKREDLVLRSYVGNPW